MKLDSEGKVAGVYYIRNRGTGRLYIGQSRDVLIRCEGHRKQLFAGRHPCKQLQLDYEIFGLSAFDFVLVEEAPDPEYSRIRREREHIKIWEGLAYNIR